MDAEKRPSAVESGRPGAGRRPVADHLPHQYHRAGAEDPGSGAQFRSALQCRRPGQGARERDPEQLRPHDEGDPAPQGRGKRGRKIRRIGVPGPEGRRIRGEDGFLPLLRPGGEGRKRQEHERRTGKRAGGHRRRHHRGVEKERDPAGQEHRRARPGKPDPREIRIQRRSDAGEKRPVHGGETATKIDAEIRKIIEVSHEEARKIILDNKEDVILIAKTLLEHEQITAEEIDYLLEHRHLKRDEAQEPVEPVSEKKEGEN